MSPAHVPGGKHFIDIRFELTVFRLHVRAAVSFQTQLVGQRRFRSVETDGDQGHLRRKDAFRTRDRLIDFAPGLVDDPLDLHSVQFLQVAVLVADKSRCHDREFTRIGTEQCFGFFLGIIERVHVRELRPRIVKRIAFERRFGVGAKLRNATATMAQCCRHTVRAGVAAADHDDILPFGGQILPVS
ncbi:hypothetical protein D3C74_263640 [compost metagenome]